MQNLQELIKDRVLIIDGAMGTQIQSLEIPKNVWLGFEGCNELLNSTFSKGIYEIHSSYAIAGADLIKTNTFGAIPWVLDDYGIGERTYELAKAGAEIVKKVCDKFSTIEKPRFVVGCIGPGTKLPSLGHIKYDEMYEGYLQTVQGLIDGGADLFLLETCQDPLQIKCAIHACQEISKNTPIMVSVTIELSGTMLIGTNAQTIATILEPFDIFSLGFNCGTGPAQVKKHIKKLSEVWHKPISVHANAGLPQNRGGYTFYPMNPEEFSQLQKEFLDFDGVSILGGCCGTTPQHIAKLSQTIGKTAPKPPTGFHPKSLASLFETVELKQNPSPFLIGERSNATGSKAFRELLLAENYDGTLSVGQEQVRNGAHGIDISVGFAGRDESKDMDIIASLYNEKILLPLMIDSTQIKALEIGLKSVGGKPIINSVNLEDGEEKFDKICALAKKYGASLVCLTIDEKGMAKTKDEKVAIAKRIYNRATTIHNLAPEDLVFDLLTFTVGSGDSQYFKSAIEVIEAIKEFHSLYPKVGFVLGVSNISFGLAKSAREFLNSVFLSHCVKVGLSMAIINVKNIIPMHKISDEDREVCENLLFNKRDENHDPLFAFIDHFSDVGAVDNSKADEEFEAKNTREKIHFLLIDGDKERMLPILKKAKDEIPPETIVNEILIGAMKEVGELFGDGKMQLPFVLQSAEVMKSSVDYLNPFLPKKDKTTQTTLILGTVKGDVHDVGKNLVDIILTNNGYKIINIGIKADIEEFIKAYKEHKADAIGMSGLLVKSTAIMQENLEELKRLNIDVPVLLGGAALTKKFVDNYCRPNYEGAIFYCKDAFDGVVAMSQIEKGEIKKITVDSENIEVKAEIPKEKIIPPLDKIKMPNRDLKPLFPPFWGRKILNTDVAKLAFDWINHKSLFSRSWGYTKKGKTKQEYQKLLDNEVYPLFERLKNEFLDKNLFKPVTIYGYFPCRADDNKLLIFDEKRGYFSKSQINKLPCTNIKPKKILTFPRQDRKPYRALSDYFQTDRDDVVAFSLASSGVELAKYIQKLYDKKKYKEYHLVSALSGELAEALAEILHKQIRLELGITENEGDSLRDVQMKKYQGKRYSAGYASCPDMKLNQNIYELLNPKEFGINLTETFLLNPEHSTMALITAHPKAIYYTI